MKNLDTSLLTLDITSVAFGYRALGEITREAGVRVLEASAIGARFLILAIGDAQDLADAAKRVQTLADGETTLVHDYAIIENWNVNVREAFYALSSVQLDESLVVVESESVSGCLVSAQSLVQNHGLRAIEIRVQRSSRAGAYGILTGSAHGCAAGAADVRVQLKSAMREGRVEVIERPSAEFARYFNVSGVADGSAGISAGRSSPAS